MINSKEVQSGKKNREYWQELIYKHGSASAIANAINVKYQIVYYNLKKHGIASSKTILDKQKLDDLGVNNICKLYQQFNSTHKLAESLNVSRDMILARLPRHLKKQNQCIKYKCNEDFFNQDNELSFYWAGFIAADGYVKLKDRKYKQLSIGLSRKDRCHLELFKQHIEFEGPVSNKKVKAAKPKWNNTIGSELTISSDAIFDSLARFNIVPRKTHIYTFPKWLISHDLVHHFMRGYFDGDGSVCFSKPRNGRKHKQLYFSVRGTPEFLITYRQILEANTLVRKRTKPIPIKNGIGSLEYGGNGIAMSIRDFLYKDATVYLQRKYDRFFHPDVKKNPRTVKESTRQAAQIARRIPIKAINIKTGEVLEYPSLADTAPQFHPGLVGDVLRGKQKTHRGFTFERITN